MELQKKFYNCVDSAKKSVSYTRTFYWRTGMLTNKISREIIEKSKSNYCALGIPFDLKQNQSLRYTMNKTLSLWTVI